MSALPMENQDGEQMTAAEFERELGTMDIPESERRQHLNQFLEDPQAYMDGIRDGSIQPVSMFGRIFQAFIASMGDAPEPAREAGRGEEVTVDTPDRTTPPQTGASGTEQDQPARTNADNNGMDAVLQRMADGTATGEDIRRFEQNTVDRLSRIEEGQVINGETITRSDAQRAQTMADELQRTVDTDIGDRVNNRMINMMGGINTEYDFYQKLIQESGVDLRSLGITNVEQIDSIQEVGAAMQLVVAQQQEQSESRGR